MLLHSFLSRGIISATFQNLVYLVHIIILSQSSSLIWLEEPHKAWNGALSVSVSDLTEVKLVGRCLKIISRMNSILFWKMINVLNFFGLITIPTLLKSMLIFFVPKLLLFIERLVLFTFFIYFFGTYSTLSGTNTLHFRFYLK